MDPINNGNGPIFVQKGQLYALNLECDLEAQIYQLTAEIFDLPKLTYVRSKPIVGPSKKSVGEAESEEKEKDATSKTEDSSSSSKKGGRTDVSGYSWGQNGSGGCGLGDYTSRREPTGIEKLPKIRFERICAGNETSFWIAGNGEVYVHGRNGSGQLGLGTSNYSNHLNPILNDKLKGHRIVKVCFVVVFGFHFLF